MWSCWFGRVGTGEEGGDGWTWPGFRGQRNTGTGEAYDDSLCEAFSGALEREVLRRCRFRAHDETRSTLFRTWRRSRTRDAGTGPWGTGRPRSVRGGSQRDVKMAALTCPRKR